MQKWSMAPVQEVWTVSATQNQNTGSGTLDEAGGYCPSVLEPPLSLQPAVSFQPQFLLRELPFQPRWSLHGSHLTECDWLTLSIVQNTRSLSTRAIISPYAVWNLCLPAAFRLRNQQQQSLQRRRQPKSGEVDAQERGRRARRLLVQAALWAPSMAERDMVLEAIAELPDPGERVPHVGRSRRARGPAFANRAGSAALRNGTSTKLRVLEETNNIPLHI